jgi:hypothetical protein
MGLLVLQCKACPCSTDRAGASRIGNGKTFLEAAADLRPTAIVAGAVRVAHVFGNASVCTLKAELLSTKYQSLP